MKIKKTTKAMTLAAGIMKNQPEITRSEALKMAWRWVKKANDMLLFLEATKVNGTITKRIVRDNWSEVNEVKGTGRPLKEGQRLFVDVAKALAGRHNTTVSFYQKNIITLAA